MTVQQVHLAYTPRGAGLACALMYLKQDPDIFGWWIGAQGSEIATAYFKLADFYSTGKAALYASEGSDLYGGWKYDMTSLHPRPIDPPMPVDPDVVHALEQAQDAFCGEWLVFEQDTDYEEQRRAYAEAELAWGKVNFQVARLNKFDKHEAVWLYYSNDFEAAVADYLTRRWPLDYGKS